MIPLNLTALNKHLDKKQMKPQLQEETNQILLAFRIDDNNFPIFLRISEEEEFVQILTFFQGELKPTAIAPLSRFLHYLNNQVNLPGLSMDEKENLIFYRTILPCSGKKIDDAQLEKYIGAAFNVCQNFHPLITEITEGKIGFDEAMKKLSSFQPATPKS